MLGRVTKLALILGLVWLVVWGVATMAAPKLVEVALSIVLPRLERSGITVDSLKHGRIELAPTLTRASANEVAAAFDLAPSDAINLSSTFDAHRIVVRLDSLLRLRGGLSVDEFEVAFHESDRPRRFPFDRLTAADVEIGDLPLLAPRQALREARDRLESMLVDNAWVGEFELHGIVMVKVRDRTLPARLYTEKQGDQCRLRFDHTDLQTLVDEARVDLSAEQIEIISLYPARVPFLFDITQQARQIAWDTYPNKRYLRDALRHVAWSYLLTSAFGSDFAKEVTDAQETRTGNTPNERAMDYHNNAVGRRLATTGTALDSLPRLIGSHPDVIRHPSEVDSREELLR